VIRLMIFWETSFTMHRWEYSLRCLYCFICGIVFAFGIVLVVQSLYQKGKGATPAKRSPPKPKESGEKARNDSAVILRDPDSRKRPAFCEHYARYYRALLHKKHHES
jgi:hypothetical protein